MSVNFPPKDLQPLMKGNVDDTKKPKEEAEKEAYISKLHEQMYSALKNPKPKKEISELGMERRNGPIGNVEDQVPTEMKIDKIKNLIKPDKSK